MRAIWIVLALVAGCLTPTQPEALSATEATVSWSHIGTSGTVEPSIGVTKNGTILVVAGEDTWASYDQGASWRMVHSLTKTNTGGVTDQPTTLDPWLWVDPVTDRVFVDHMWPVLTCTLLATSDDGGATWSPETPACPSPVVDFQKLVTGVPGPEPNPLVGGYPSVAYMCFNKPVFDLTGNVPVGRYGLSCASSYDGGISWMNEAHLSGAVVVMGQVMGDCFGGSWNPAVGPDGTVVVRAQPDCLYRSRDSGASWQAIGTGPTEFGGTQLAWDDAGTLYAMSGYFEGPVQLARSFDQGDTWEPAIRLNLDAQQVAFSSFAARGAGEIGLAFYGTRDVNVTESTKWTPWMGQVTWPANGSLETDLAEVFEEPVHVGCLRRGQGCPFLGDFMGATFGPDGALWAVWVDDCPTDCKTNPDATASDLGPRDALVARWARGDEAVPR